MKKHSFLMMLLGVVVTLGLSTLLTSCEIDDDTWPYSPPPGWGSKYFFDSRLEGSWELTPANASEVGGYDTNYMEFYGNGHGRYYYYDRGRPYQEDMAYFCQRSGSTTSSYLINVQYADGTSSTMTYWFSEGDYSLWLQWRENSGQVTTYLYRRVAYVP